jgi:hypothetical protein
MAFISAYPRQFKTFINFLNIEINGEPTVEDTALYEYFDTLFDVCYEEAEGYCGQPLRALSVNYQFYGSKLQKTLNKYTSWKFIPYSANTQLSSLSWRENEFATYSALSANNYIFSNEPYGNYIILKNNYDGQFKAVLTTGYTDANMPNTVLQGIAEMAALIYKQSAQGGNWFGLSSISTGGAGQSVNNSLKLDITWQKYFNKYIIPTV